MQAGEGEVAPQQAGVLHRHLGAAVGPDPEGTVGTAPFEAGLQRAQPALLDGGIRPRLPVAPQEIEAGRLRQGGVVLVPEGHLQGGAARQPQPQAGPQPLAPVPVEVVVQAQQRLGAVDQQGVAVRRDARHLAAAVLQVDPKAGRGSRHDQGAARGGGRGPLLLLPSPGARPRQDQRFRPRSYAPPPPVSRPARPGPPGPGLRTTVVPGAASCRRGACQPRLPSRPRCAPPTRSWPRSGFQSIPSPGRRTAPSPDGLTSTASSPPSSPMSTSRRARKPVGRKALSSRREVSMAA